MQLPNQVCIRQAKILDVTTAKLYFSDVIVLLLTLQVRKAVKINRLTLSDQRVSEAP